MFDGKRLLGDTLNVYGLPGQQLDHVSLSRALSKPTLNIIAVDRAVASNTGADTITFKRKRLAQVQASDLSTRLAERAATRNGSAVSLNSQNAASCNSARSCTSIHNDFLIGFCATANAFNSLVGGGKRDGLHLPLSSLGVDGYYDALYKRNRNRLDNRFVAYSDKRPFFRPIRSSDHRRAFTKRTSSSTAANPRNQVSTTRTLFTKRQPPAVTGPNLAATRFRTSPTGLVRPRQRVSTSAYTAIHRAVPIPCSALFRRARSRLRRVGTR